MLHQSLLILKDLHAEPFGVSVTRVGWDLILAVTVVIGGRVILEYIFDLQTLNDFYLSLRIYIFQISNIRARILYKVIIRITSIQ